MTQLIEITAYAILAPAYLYILAWVVFMAYFQQKRAYHDNLMRDVQQDPGAKHLVKDRAVNIH